MVAELWLFNYWQEYHFLYLMPLNLLLEESESNLAGLYSVANVVTSGHVLTRLNVSSIF